MLYCKTEKSAWEENWIMNTRYFAEKKSGHILLIDQIVWPRPNCDNIGRTPESIMDVKN